MEDLIARARAGDRAALERLFEWCRPFMDDLAVQGLAGKHAGIARPSDIAQEAGIRAFRSFGAFEGTTENQWFAWLQSIVDSCVTQAFRDAGRMKRDSRAESPLEEGDALEIPAPNLSPSQATAAEEQWRQVFSWIFQLPEEQKRAVWLCHLKEMRVADAAALMGKSEGAVAGLLQRALRTLRERAGSDGTITTEPPAASAGQEEAAAALLAYLRRRDAGERVDAAAFVAEHPSCAEELRAALEWIERIQALRPAQVEE